MGGNVKLILGLVWMLIQKYHIQAEDARRSMLDWIQVCLLLFEKQCNSRTILKLQTTCTYYVFKAKQ